MKWFNLLVLSVALSVVTSSTVQAGSSRSAETLQLAHATLFDAIQKKVQIDKLTTPGDHDFYRAHVSKENTAAVKELSGVLLSRLAWLQPALSKLLTSYRVGELESADVSQLQNMLSVYNAFLADNARTNLVYDSENLFGSYGSKVNIFAGRDYRVALTVFDFTTGFAKQCKSVYGSGVVAYRDSETAAIQWAEAYKSGIAVVQTDGALRARTRDVYKTGISSAYNPSTERWEVNQGSYKSPNASVYDPNIRRVVSREGGRNTGIGGVYNPTTKTVEWRTEYKTGVAGYFDENLGRVVWETEYKGGVACVVRTKTNEYIFSSGFYGGEKDDDD